MNITLQSHLITNIAHIATIIGVFAALIVYIFNSLAMRKQRIIDNAERYHRIHSVVFAEDSYPVLNVAAMEKGTFKRDTSDELMERKLNRFLGNMEWLALFHNAGAIPSSINAYMIGWFAKNIYPILSDREKAEPYWLLAVEFLKETKLKAEKLDKESQEDLLKFIKTNHFK